MGKLINISTLAKILDLIDPKTKKTKNHVIRYWEKEFNIKSRMINNRRYFTPKQIEIYKMINFLLKNQGLTISGVKKIIKQKINKLDVHNTTSLSKAYKKNIKEKAKILIEKINKIKSYGKENSS